MLLDKLHPVILANRGTDTLYINVDGKNYESFYTVTICGELIKSIEDIMGKGSVLI